MPSINELTDTEKEVYFLGDEVKNLIKYKQAPSFYPLELKESSEEEEIRETQITKECIRITENLTQKQLKLDSFLLPRVFIDGKEQPDPVSKQKRKKIIKDADDLIKVVLNLKKGIIIHVEINKEDDKNDSSNDMEMTSHKNLKRDKDKLLEEGWISYKSILYYNPPESNDSSKIAAFDMGNTLITSASGRTFPPSRIDWKWMYPNIPKKLNELHENGYKIVILSNQLAIGRGKTSKGTIQGKILDIEEECDVPLSAVLATIDDEFRKPSPNLFEFFTEAMITKNVDYKESFYVGDLAGRINEWAPGKTKDKGCTDRKFASNIGINFKTPEEFFLDEKTAPFEWGTINPKLIEEADTFNSEEFISDEQEVIIFVGYPSSGKTTFAKQYLTPHGYVHISRDIYKSTNTVFKGLSKALAEGKSVVIDDTNPSIKGRHLYIKIAESSGVSIRCFYFNTSFELSKHLNNLRVLVSKGDYGVTPMVAYNMFQKQYQKPSLGEGFSEIKEIGFRRHHPNTKHRNLFNQWTER